MNYRATMDCGEVPMYLLVLRWRALLQTLPSQKNPIETSDDVEQDGTMFSDESAMKWDGGAVYFVVLNSSLCP